MPYIDDARKDYLKGPWQEITAGDINYLFTELIIKKWLKNPRYQTIHDIRRGIARMDFDTDFSNLHATLFEHGVSDVDIQVAGGLAFQEFYRRIASDYEDYKASVNGDVYQVAIDDLYDQLDRAALAKGERE